MSRSSCKTRDFHHQPVFAVVATSRDAARRAVLRGKIEIDAEKPNVTVEQGRASGEVVMPDYAFINGDAGKGHRRVAAAERGKDLHRRPGAFLSGRAGRARRAGRRRRGVGLFVDPASERSAACRGARLGVPDSFVTCRVRRMGGGFGGKETQATQWAVIAALAARVTGRPCKLPARSRCRHGDDRQAPRFRRRVCGRLRCRRPYPRRRPRSRCALRMFRRSSVSASSTAPCSTPTMRISCRNPESIRAASRPTQSQTPRSAASAARRACWRSSA